MRSKWCWTVVMLAFLAGCSSAGEPAPEPTPDASTDTSLPSEPTSPASASVPPAQGTRVDAEVVAYHLPDADWTLGRAGLTATFTDERYQDWVISAGPATAIARLDRLAAIRLDWLSIAHDGVQRAENRTVNGVEGYVLTSGGRDGLLYEYGAIHGGSRVYLTFDFPEDSPMAEEWIESVLASIEWK